MNQLEAARETAELMNEFVNRYHSPHVPPWHHLPESMQPNHINEMLAFMELGYNPQGGSFSEGKMGRWLGWMQASVVAMKAATLDDMKELNKRWSDK